MINKGLKLAFNLSKTVKEKYEGRIEGKKNNMTVDELFDFHTKNHGRFLSWERCYKFFKDNEELFLSKSPVELSGLYQRAEVELGFYLASFGMYRGSSVLLIKDSSIYSELISSLYAVVKDEELSKEEAEKNGLEYEDKLNSKLYKQCDEWIKKIKDGKKNYYDNKILITKILMGIFGYVPAFDRFFQDGLRIAKEQDERFKDLTAYVRDIDKWREAEGTTDGFIPEELANEFSKLDFHFHAPYDEAEQYPLMRKIDIYFWFIGFCSYETDKEEDKTNDENQ